MDIRNCSKIRFLCCVALFAGSPIIWANTKPELVVRRAAEIGGKVVGAIQVLEADTAGAMDIAPGASVAGDILVPPPKRSRLAKEPRDETKSGGALVTNRGDALSFRGTVLTAEAFELPRVVAARAKRDGAVVIVQENAPSLRFHEIADLTLENERSLVSLPPGSYRHISVKQGVLLLGIPGAAQPLRYDFHSLQVGVGARIELASPVILTLAEGGQWAGAMGKESAPLWLDLRVATADVSLAETAKFWGHLSAPASKVSLTGRSSLIGGILCDRLVVGRDATISAVEVDWAAPSSKSDAPTLAQRGVRLQRQMPRLKTASKSRYFPGVSYVDDVPYIMLAEGERPEDAGLAEKQEREALFDAFYSTFVEAGFDRVVIMLTSDPLRFPERPPVRNLSLTRAKFEQWVAEVGDHAASKEGLQTVRENPEFLRGLVESASVASQRSLPN